MTQPPSSSNPNLYPVFPWAWNPSAAFPIPRKTEDDKEDEEDSWEVRAFAEDSASITWPPRSYTCTFCRREFRSAQALGGHMNVHRRDRAQLRQLPPSPSRLMVSPHACPWPAPAVELVQNDAGFCVVCPQFLSPSDESSAPDAGKLLNFGISERGINVKVAETEVEELDLELRLGN